MIVKMIILRHLGSSDDKEKIGVARPEGPPLWGFRYPVSGRGSRGSRPSRVSGQRHESSSVQRTRIEETVKKSSQNKQDRDILLSPVKPMMSKIILTGAINPEVEARVLRRLNRQ